MKDCARDFLVEKAHELLNAASCCPELKEAAKAFLDAAGKDNEDLEAKKLIAEAEEDIITIDGLIAFAGSEAGASVFGAEKAKEVKKHGEEIKAAGAKYCDCPACTACEAILAKREELTAC